LNGQKSIQDKTLGVILEDQIISILGRLVEINSVNPTLSGGPGEAELADFVWQYLHKLKLDAELQKVSPGRANVAARIPGRHQAHSILLNSHLDTVGVEGMPSPFELRRENDRLYGRGTYDMKGSVAIMLLLADYFSRNPPPLDVLLTFVADEEDLSAGMEHLVNNWLEGISPAPFGAVFLEPTEEAIGVCHKGFNWYELEVFGQAAHGSRPEQGIDAILPLGSVLKELDQIQQELLDREPDPLLGHASVHASVIEGGTELSVIPRYARLKWERRTLPGDPPGLLKTEFDRLIRTAENHPGNHDVAARQLFERPPHRVAENARIVKYLKAASPQSQIVGLSFWADSALAAQAGIPAALFGPIGHGAHAVDEWVSLKSLRRVYEVLKKLIETG
jgi:acetylornithine deacetylase